MRHRWADCSQRVDGPAQGRSLSISVSATGWIDPATALPEDATLAAAVGQAKRALVIGAETFSRILDWTDRGTCVLFGDGAGAIVLEARSEAEAGGRGILSTHIHSDGRFRDILYVDGGPSTTNTVGKLRMNGKEVFRHAVKNLADVVEESLAANGLEPSAIDWLVPHQANQRMIGTRPVFGG